VLVVPSLLFASSLINPLEPSTVAIDTQQQAQAALSKSIKSKVTGFLKHLKDRLTHREEDCG